MRFIVLSPVLPVHRVVGTLIGPPRARLGSSMRVPSGRVIETKRPPFLPSRNGLVTTVTLSPGFSVVDRHPWRRRLFGLLSSIIHRSCPPESFGTSR